MNKSTKYTIGDIAEIIGGGTPSTKNPEYWDGDIPWLTPRDLTGYNKIYIRKGERNISGKGLNNSSSRILPKGTVLFTSRAPIGYIAIAENELCTNQGFKNLVVNQTKADSKFIYYWLKNNIDYLQSIGTGSTFAEISGSVLKSVEILLPPLPEQRAIAGVLSSLDDKIDLLHRQNMTLEAIAETLFRQWFVEEADEGWEEGKLRDVVSIVSGTTPSTKVKEYWDGNINWTSPRDITSLNQVYLFDTERKITERGLQQISSGLLPKGTLLMSSRAPVGALAFAELPLAINQGYAGIICDKGYSREYIYLWLKVNMDYVKSHANGSTFQEISKTTFKELNIKLPSKMALLSFQTTVTPIFEKIKINTLQICSINKIHCMLLPNLISGEKRILYE